MENAVNLLWLFIPDSALVLVIAGVGLAVLLGIIRGRQAASILGGIVLMLLLTPFLESLFDALPLWLTLILTLAICFSILRCLAGFLLGSQAGDHMVGTLAADAVRFCFAGFLLLLSLPFRMLGWLLRRGS